MTKAPQVPVGGIQDNNGGCVQSRLLRPGEDGWSYERLVGEWFVPFRAANLPCAARMHCGHVTVGIVVPTHRGTWCLGAWPGGFDLLFLEDSALGRTFLRSGQPGGITGYIADGRIRCRRLLLGRPSSSSRVARVFWPSSRAVFRLPSRPPPSTKSKRFGTVGHQDHHRPPQKCWRQSYCAGTLAPNRRRHPKIAPDGRARTGSYRATLECRDVVRTGP
jgi:hypothetical protein